jgi:hypothetical protein
MRSEGLAPILLARPACDGAVRYGTFRFDKGIKFASITSGFFDWRPFANKITTINLTGNQDGKKE